MAYNPLKKHLAVGHNDGTLTIRKGPLNCDLGDVIHTCNNTTEWIEAMEYSPDGNLLAVGSHDNCVYIHDVNKDY